MNSINITSNGNAITRKMKTMRQIRYDYARRSVLYSAHSGVGTALSLIIARGTLDAADFLVSGVAALSTAFYRYKKAPDVKKMMQLYKPEYDKIVERAERIYSKKA